MFSITTYRCEIWGINIAHLHLQTTSKTVLGVQKSSCNVAVYGDIGRSSLYVKRYIRIIKYWLKICHGDNTLTNTVFYLLIIRCWKKYKKNTGLVNLKILDCQYENKG